MYHDGVRKCAHFLWYVTTRTYASHKSIGAYVRIGVSAISRMYHFASRSLSFRISRFRVGRVGFTPLKLCFDYSRSSVRTKIEIRSFARAFNIKSQPSRWIPARLTQLVATLLSRYTADHRLPLSARNPSNRFSSDDTHQWWTREYIVLQRYKTFL